MNPTLLPWPKSFWPSIVYGWLSLLSVLAVWAAVAGGNTAPFDLPTAYLVFASIYSIFYLIDYLFLVPLSYWLLVWLWPTSRPWQWGIVGAAQFVSSIFVWLAIFQDRDVADAASLSTLGGIAGWTSFYVLRRLNPTQIKV